MARREPGLTRDVQHVRDQERQLRVVQVCSGEVRHPEGGVLLGQRLLLGCALAFRDRDEPWTSRWTGLGAEGSGERRRDDSDARAHAQRVRRDLLTAECTDS